MVERQASRSGAVPAVPRPRDALGAIDGELAAENRRRQFGALLKHSPQAIAILDADGCLREWNPAAVDLLGWTRAEVVGGPMRLHLPAGEQTTFDEVWLDLVRDREAKSMHSAWVHRDRSQVRVDLTLAPIQDEDGSFAGVVATLSRLTTHGDPDARDDAVESPPLIDHSRQRPPTVLEVDDLTGLPGRRWLQRRLAAPVVAGHQRAAAVVDVDAFALVNQEYGPDAADDVLRDLAARLSALCGPTSVGRWQADEFVIVVDDPDAADHLAAHVDAVLEAARRPFQLPDGPVRLSISAGLADSSTVPVSLLFNAASAAMSEAKDRGRDRLVWFQGDAPPAAGVSGLRMADDLHRSLAAGELRLHYQPIVELSTNDVVGVEALLRWQRPGVGLLQPGAFIALAERTGQIVALGGWVIQQACRAAVELDSTRLAPLRVSINVSARQLSDPGLVETLEGALRATGCDPTTLAVEVTETALLRDLGAAAEVLESIQALGVELDLDDFGTGYSSLLYLKHFPVSRIKIDRSFVSGLGTDVADTAIVASTIALAHSFGLTAIAEGVETPRQLTMLRQLGCDFAQGYLLCHPLPYDELVAWLQQQLPSRLLVRGPDDSHLPDTGPRRTAGRRHRTRGGRDVALRADDVAGDTRDLGADQRDQAGDLRDRAGDRRDDAADLRDRLADERDHAADRRDDRAASTAPEEAALPDVRVLQTELTLSAAARQEAARDRSQASRDREVGAEERSQAVRDRQTALVDRQAAVDGRTTSALDRSHATADGTPPGHDRGTETYDVLTGAYLLEAGLHALQDAVDDARRNGTRMTVTHVSVTRAIGNDDSQLSEDALMVVAANGLGVCLRREDLLIRFGTTQFLCAMPGTGQDEAAERLAPLQEALAGPPPFGTAVVAHVEVVGDERVEELVARAGAAGAASSSLRER